MASQRNPYIAQVHSSTPGAKQFAHSVGASSKKKCEDLLSENRFSQIKTDEYMNNTPERVEGTTSLVTWFMHGGKTQIHIATANIREAHFDISIIPVDLTLNGHGTDPSESYKDIMPHENKFVVEGDVVWCHKSEDFACKEVALAVIILKETVTAPANDSMYKVVRDIFREVKKHNLNTIGIQLNDGYDVSKFVRTLNERRCKQHSEKLSVFLCTHDKNAELTNVVKDIDQLVQKTKLTRRLTSPEMHELFPRLKIRTRIHRGSLLDSGCQCVVAAIGKKLNFKQGGITKQIADAAGKETQKYLQEYGDVVEHWKVMYCPVGKLSDEGLLCLLFGCMPKWEKKGDSVHIPKRLAKFIFDSLLMADETGCSSIAIPLVGTGRLKYHESTVFVALLDGIELYAQLATLRRIKEVVISLPDIDDDSYKLYLSELQRRGNRQRKFLFKNAKVKVLSSTNTGTKYSIVNAQDLQDQLPIEFVDVVLNNSSDKKGNVLPVMIGGKLKVDSEINQQNFESIMRRVVETCETKKISTIVVYTSRLPAIQAVIQAKGIINASESYKDKIYLYTVVVAVSNTDEYTACKVFTKDRNIGTIKSITTLKTVYVGPIFMLQEECHDDREDNVYIVNANQSDPEPTDQSNTSERESSTVQHRTHTTTNIQNVAVTAELGAKPKMKLFRPSVHYTRNPPASWDETSRKVNQGPSTSPSKKKSGATSADEAEICVIIVNYRYTVHGSKKLYPATVEYKCTVEKYMKWRFLQCSQLKREELSSDGYCLHQDSTIDIKKSATDKLHAEKLARHFIDQIVAKYCNDVSVDQFCEAIHECVLNQANKELDVYTEIIGGVFYMAYISNQKLHILQSFLDLITKTCTYDKRNCQKEVTVKHDFLKFDKMEVGKLCKQYPQVTFKMQEQSGCAVCILRGSPEDVGKAVSAVIKVDEHLCRLPVDLMVIAAELLMNSNILNKVQHKLSSEFSECLLSVEDEHISVIGFYQVKVEQAAELVAGLISIWTKKLSKSSSVKANDIGHLIQKTFGDLVVVEVDTSLQMYVCGLKEDVDKVKTLVVDIEEGKVSLEKNLPFPELVSGSTCSYQFQIRLERLAKFLKKSTYLEKLAQQCNCEVILRTDNVVEIEGDEADTLVAKHKFETFLKEIKDEKIYIAKHNEQEYIQSSLQFVSNMETECDVSIEKCYKCSITSHSNFVIEKNTCCESISWETNFFSSERKLIVQEFDEKTDYEGLQMKFAKSAHDRSCRWSKTDNTATVSVPNWINGNQNEFADFSSIISKGLDDMSSRQIDKVVIYAQPVVGWEFCLFMKCIVSECTQWLVQSPNISPWKVTIIVDGSNNKDLTDTCVDTYILYYLNINVDARPVVKVVEGNLGQTEADILVNTVARNLDLKQGKVSKSLSKAAGPGLQSECMKQYPDGIDFDDVAYTEGYRLRCKKVFHVTLPPFSMDAPDLHQNLLSIRKPMMNCLEHASKHEFKTIAFPAIGTGNRGYPIDVVAFEMFDSIKRFRQSHPRTSLQEVLFVIYKKDTELLKHFRALESTFAKKTEANEQHDMWLEITGLPEDIKSAQREIEKTMRIISNPDAEITELFGDIPKSVCTVFFEACYGKVVEIRKLTKFNYDEQHHSFTITGKVNAVVKCLVMVSKNIETIRNMHQCQLPVTGIDTESVNRLLTGMKESADGSYFLAYDKEKCVVDLFAITSDVLQAVFEDMKAKLKMLLDEDYKHKSAHKLNSEDARKGELEEIGKYSIIDKGNQKKEKKGARSLLQRSSDLSRDILRKEVFKTTYLDVKVYTADILTLPVDAVDAIVNATNGRLEHGEGVAQILAELAGKDLVEESRSIIKEQKGGQLPVASVVVTTAGCLPYKCVLHAVGPCWIDYKPITIDNLERCERDLQNTITNCFMKAVEMKLDTIALPTISSGLFGVPMEICAEQYALAIIKYARHESLKEVHFVNNDCQSDIIPIIQKVFSEMITNKKQPQLQKDQYLEAPAAAANQHDASSSSAKDMKAKLKMYLDEEDKHKSAHKLNPDGARKSELEEESMHSKMNKGNTKRERKCADSLLQRSFSWSQDASSLYVFKTKYLVVNVYKADIMTVPVDAIVNAANGTLEHCGGVAKKIAKHAGKDLVEESKSIIKKEKGGQLPVGSVVVTTAGRLPYKCVFHAVGPRWSDYKPMTKDNLKRCERDLQNTIAKCFMKAVEIELDTIALPMISSGLFGMPVEICAEQYALAIIKYARNESLKEVHFVNNDSQSNIIPIIQEVFSEMITNSKQSPFPKDQSLEAPVAAAIQHVAGTGTAKDKLKNTCKGKPASVGEIETKETIKRVKANEITVTVNVCHRTKDDRLMCIITEKETCLLNVYEGDIFSIENVEAVVCGDNKDGGGQGMIAKELRKHGGNKYLEDKARKFASCPNISDVVITSGGGSKYRWIMHVIMLRNSTKLYKAYRNVFEDARMRQFQSIVLPLLGTGNAAISIRDSAETLWVEWIQYCEKYRDDLPPLNVHVVLKDPAVLMDVQTLFKLFVDNIEKCREDTSEADSRKLASVKVVKGSTDDDGGSKTKKSKVKPASKMEESCVVCMDSMDNPKKLKCGHSFCTDCIDGYFKVKQVCPTCGQVCGIITGDQPDGFLELCKRRKKLEGYDKNTCFALSYTFLASVQGPNHPQPGMPYKMMKRTGYLPDTKEGRTVCAMMKVAFERKLVFTIGTSRTTGEQGVIRWNDIHHKTNPKPNTQFGYPDPTYLDRVTDELAAKGVTSVDINKAFLKRLNAEHFKETIYSGTGL